MVILISRKGRVGGLDNDASSNHPKFPRRRHRKDGTESPQERLTIPEQDQGNSERALGAAPKAWSPQFGISRGRLFLHVPQANGAANV